MSCFTWRLEHSQLMKQGVVTYSWSYMLAWIGIALLLILFFIILVLVCFYRLHFRPLYMREKQRRLEKKSKAGILNSYLVSQAKNQTGDYYRAKVTKKSTTGVNVNPYVVELPAETQRYVGNRFSAETPLPSELR